LPQPDNSFGDRGKHVRSASVRKRGSRVAVIRLGRPSDCTDGIGLEDGNEHHEAQRSDADREEAQKFLDIGSYAFSNSR
jgi:hypothetical protein